MINPAVAVADDRVPASGTTTSAVAGLAPTSRYEFQVRLIRMVDGITTHFSDRSAR